MNVILGIDPGLNTTGYGVIDVSTRKVRLVEAGVVKSRTSGVARKVKEIYDGVREVIEMFSPEVVAMEQLYTHYDRPTTAILMGHARGCICLAAAQSDIEVISYTATKVKKLLTGSGRATKDQMQRAIKLELGLEQYPEPPDVADALAIAICHLYQSQSIAQTTIPTSGIDRHFPINMILR